MASDSPVGGRESGTEEARPAMTADQKQAVGLFQKAMGETKAWLGDFLEEARDKEAFAHLVPRKLFDKLGAVPVNGLPDDLAKAFSVYLAQLGEQAALFKGMPEDEEGIMTWTADQFAEESFATRAAKLQDAVWEAEANMIKTAAVYGAEKEADLFGESGEPEDGVDAPDKGSKP
jgi:hypothetical protein